MNSPYHLCAYGHVVRVCNNRRLSPDMAAKDCFGIVSSRVTVLPISGKGWNYISQKERERLIQVLAVRHRAKTGNTIVEG